MEERKDQLTAVTADTLNLSELAHFRSSLNILEVDILVLAEIDDTSKIVEETLGSLVFLKEVDQPSWAQEIGVFGGDLNNGSKVLTNVSLQHGIQAVQRLLEGKAAEEADKPVLAEARVRNNVHDHALDRLRVVIVLQGSLIETGLLTQLCDSRSIVMREHVVTKDSVGDLRSINKIHLKEASLQVALLRLVVLESIEKERGGRLDLALGLEDVDNTFNINQRTSLMVCQLSSKLGGLFGIDAD